MTAVLFDFSGTLFRIESAESWLRAVLAETGLALPEIEPAETACALDAAGALPGGASPTRLPEGVADVWEIRCESPALHRAALHRALPPGDAARCGTARGAVRPPQDPCRVDAVARRR